MAEEWHEATTKQELLDAIAQEYARLVGLVEQFDADKRTVPLVDALSLKDLIAHITDWEDYALKRLRASALGEVLPLRVPDGDFDRVNAEIYATHKDRAWSDIWLDFARTHEETLAEVAALSEDDLFNPDRQQAVTGLPNRAGEAAFGLIEGNSSNHYWEHANEIEAQMGR